MVTHPAAVRLFTLLTFFFSTRISMVKRSTLSTRATWQNTIQTRHCCSVKYVCIQRYLHGRQRLVKRPSPSIMYFARSRRISAIDHHAGDLQDLYDLDHVIGWDPYDLHDPARDSWVGSVHCRSCAIYHNERQIQDLVDLDRDLSDHCEMLCTICGIQVRTRV